MYLNHPKTIPPPPSVENLSSLDVPYELERCVPRAWHIWLASELPYDMVGAGGHRPSAALFLGRQI